MALMDRRGFAKQAAGGVLTFALLDTLVGCDAFGRKVRPEATRWVRDLEMLTRDLKGARLPQTEWQAKVEELLGRVPLEDARETIDFERLARWVKHKERGATRVKTKLPRIEGITDVSFVHQVFAMRKDRAIIPHGHENMVSAFYVLGGSFRGRHYEKIEDDGTTMVIRPTSDLAYGPTQQSTVSDYRQNVHWFTALTDESYILNVHIKGVDEGKASSGRIYVDPAGETLPDGSIRALRKSRKDVLALYG